jgi:DNA polymerase-4
MTNSVKPRSIIHLDMDAFYPAVEVLDNPALKGKPVIVGGSRARGVVSSASYEARKFGVHSAQPISTAKRLCPKAIFLPVRMSRYKEISRQVFVIFHRFTPLVEPLSIDEAFLDVTDSVILFGQPKDIAKKIKGLVVKETGLTISAGVAPSKFVAKIASDMEKPDGLTVVPPDRVRDFLDPLPIKKMWGAGKVTQGTLKRLNIRTFKDLSQIPVETMKEKFGKHGLQMQRLSMGIDGREVITGHEVKSIGHEETFAQDILETAMAKKELLSLSGRLARRMRRHGLEGRTITLKVKYHDFVLITRSTTLPEFTDDGLVIYSTICGLLEKTAVGTKPVRLLGISLSQLSRLSSGVQLGLFEPDKLSDKRKKLNTTLDSLHERFGKRSVLPGTLLTKQ